MSEKPTDVVVTGLGLLSSLGIGIQANWDSMLALRSGIGCLSERDDEGPRPPGDWQSSPKAGVWIGAPICGFDAAQFVRPRKALKVMSRDLQTAFAASQMAMEHAGVPAAVESKAIACEEIATIFGSQMLYGPASELLDAVKNSMGADRLCEITRFGQAAMRDVMPLWMLKYLPNMAACHVGIAIGALGPNNTIVAGDVSATAAMIETISTLERGAAKLAIVGSTGSRVDETYLVYRGDSPSPSVHDPLSESSRPHSCDADGIVYGESASALVVESRLSASTRGAAELAMISGYAARFVAPEPGRRGSARSISLAIEGALEKANLKPDDLGLVVSHGTGDPMRDEAERLALDASVPRVPLCMPISIAGHTGSAIGGLHMVTAVLALTHQTIPPVAKHGCLPESVRERVTDQPRRLERPHVLVLTHTSQGNANAIIFSAS